MAKVLITDTILRDAHQSQAATRMRLDEMLPAAPMLDSVGYYSLECWGGATFDACLRFLNEDPGSACAPLKGPCPIPSCRCFSEVRIFWVTSIMRTMLWITL